MLTNKISCNIIIHDSKRVSRSLKTEHERIKRTTNAISKVKTKITKLRQKQTIKNKNINFLESLILAQDERWRRA